MIIYRSYLNHVINIYKFCSGNFIEISYTHASCWQLDNRRDNLRTTLIIIIIYYIKYVCTAELTPVQIGTEFSDIVYVGSVAILFTDRNNE